MLAGDPLCHACGAKAPVELKREEKQKDFAARLAVLPETVAMHLRDLEAQRRNNPQSVALRVQLSAAYQEIGFQDKAAENLEKAIELDPHNSYLKQKLKILIGGPTASASAAGIELEMWKTRRYTRLVGYAALALALLAAGWVAYRVLRPAMYPLAQYEKADAVLPKFSPDSTRVAFIKTPKFTLFGMVDMMAGKSPGDTALMVKNLATGEIIKVATFTYSWNVSDFLWVPGRDALAFADYDEKTSTSTLFFANADGGEPQRIAQTREYAFASEGGRLKLAYVEPPEYRFNPATSRLEDIAGGLFVKDMGSGAPSLITRQAASNPIFSPNGRYLAFQAKDVSDREDAAAATRASYTGDIFIYDMATGTTKCLTTGGVYRNPVFTPKGDRIAYLAHNDVDSFDNALFVMNLEGGDQRLVLSKGEQYVGFNEFAFHPDGERLVFEGVFINPDKPKSEAIATPLGMVGGETNYVTDLFEVRLDGSGLQRLPARKLGYRRGPNFSPDGRLLAFEVEFLKMRREAWVMRY